ncbi:MAG: alpha/beta hydrolase [Pseudomonadota bacterium]
MKKILLGVVAILILGAGAFGVVLYTASRGQGAGELEAVYMQASDRMVEIAGARVRVREEGSPSNPPVLLIHGFTHSLETWDAWALALRDDYRVIRYDLLGHGLTGPDPQKRYAPEERAAFIGAVLDALEINKTAIAGNSLGGLAAWRFASAYPERVSALALISPGALPLNGVGDEPAPIPAPMKAYLLTAPEAGVRASAQLIYGDDAKITEERLQTMRDMMRREGNGAAMIESLKEFTLPDPSEALAAIAAPTLILWGAEDIIIPVAQGREIAAMMPNAELIEYPGVGHAAQEEAPMTSVADFKDFLSKQTALTELSAN